MTMVARMRHDDSLATMDVIRFFRTETRVPKQDRRDQKFYLKMDQLRQEWKDWAEDFILLQLPSFDPWQLTMIYEISIQLKLRPRPAYTERLNQHLTHLASQFGIPLLTAITAAEFHASLGIIPENGTMRAIRDSVLHQQDLFNPRKAANIVFYLAAIDAMNGRGNFPTSCSPQAIYTILMQNTDFRDKSVTGATSNQNGFTRRLLSAFYWFTEDKDMPPFALQSRIDSKGAQVIDEFTQAGIKKAADALRFEPTGHQLDASFQAHGRQFHLAFDGASNFVRAPGYGRYNNFFYNGGSLLDIAILKREFNKAGIDDPVIRVPFLTVNCMGPVSKKYLAQHFGLARAGQHVLMPDMKLSLPGNPVCYIPV